MLGAVTAGKDGSIAATVVIPGLDTRAQALAWFFGPWACQRGEAIEGAMLLAPLPTQVGVEVVIPNCCTRGSLQWSRPARSFLYYFPTEAGEDFTAAFGRYKEAGCRWRSPGPFSLKPFLSFGDDDTKQAPSRQDGLLAM